MGFCCLDLLSTSIIWGVVAPISFILKSIGSFLKWLHFWGFTNASKSSTGKIILAIDGHHNDSRYVLNISNIDTIARLGEAIGKTTFPKLVDEVAFGETLKFMINQLKSAIENKILRTKFMSSKSGTATDIPSLSPLIMTSNPPPPFYDSAYMRRVIERSFSQSESHKEDEQIAIEFKELLRINLDRLKHLGDFRNWFVIKNQHLILDDKKLTAMELGKKILIAAYEYAGLSMPDWFDKFLPENQLEESLSDNKVDVKRAFEAYITNSFDRFLPLWRTENPELAGTKLPTETSTRLTKLLDSNRLPDIKRHKTDKDTIIIYNGILEELYRLGVTKDQLPNLGHWLTTWKLNILEILLAIRS